MATARSPSSSSSTWIWRSGSKEFEDVGRERDVQAAKQFGGVQVGERLGQIGDAGRQQPGYPG